MRHGEPSRYPKRVRQNLKTLLGDTGVDAATLLERRSVIDGTTRVEKELAGESRTVESTDREVAKFALQEFLAEEELIAELMRLPENDRRHRQREFAWRTSKKPCPAGCDQGRIEVMDSWVRCEACHGRGWVI